MTRNGITGGEALGALGIIVAYGWLRYQLVLAGLGSLRGVLRGITDTVVRP